MSFSMQNLINTLINIITGSPTSILFIVLGIIFTIAMIVNIKKNKTIGKTLFIIGWIFITLFIIIKYNNYLSKIFDNLINNVFMQIFFPNIATYLIIIIITNFIFLFTILNKESKTSDKIINSFFFTIIMVLMIMTIEQISKNNINVYVKEEVYTNQNILTLIESTTIIFGLWQLIVLSKLTLKKLINKSNEKIKKEYESNQDDKTQEEIKITPDETPAPIIQETIIPTMTPEPIIQETIIPTMTPEPIIQETIIPTMTPELVIQETIIPTMTPELVIQETIIPTMTPELVIQETIIPTMTPGPVIQETIIPTMTPEPVIQETIIPTMTPEPVIQETIIPTMTPEPVIQETIIPTMTPGPVIQETIIPTMTPEPVIQETIIPTMTPEPVIQETVIPTMTPAPIIQYQNDNQQYIESPENIFFTNLNYEDSDEEEKIETLRL